VGYAGAGTYGLWARPRPLQAQLTIGAAGTVAAQAATIYDGGLFFGVPTPVLPSVGAGLIAAGIGSIIGQSTITFSMGCRPDVVLLQPLKV
jgi:hypothetical protein